MSKEKYVQLKNSCGMEPIVAGGAFNGRLLGVDRANSILILIVPKGLEGSMWLGSVGLPVSTRNISHHV